ncbi:MAG: hypothetical protein FD123_3946 [Bacteroidetes bacterium]|nr:MAG: hypothetical protein FD123_3946 [Bacteroidota bacterium]
MKFLKSRLFRAIASIGLAALIYFLCPPCFNSMYLLAVLAVLLILINFNTFFAKIPMLTHVARLLVGGLFIFSGFIKANDPVGFSYKLEEYFEVFGQGFSCEMKIEKNDGPDCEVNEQKAAAAPAAPQESFMKPFWDFFAHNSLFLSIVICGVEIMLGIFLLMGFQVRISLWLFLAMIVFFSFLTFYSACCNKVTSCGCFGDAIKLTPWESFWKDLILLMLITVLFVGSDNIKPLFGNKILFFGIIGIGTIASFWFPVHTKNHLPMIDFRPYKIGTNICKGVQVPEPCVPDQVETILYYKNLKTDSIKAFTMKNYPWQDTLNWAWYCTKNKLIKEGNCKRAIPDFTITSSATGNDTTNSLMCMQGPQFMLVMHDIDKAERDVMGSVNDFYALCQKNNIPFYAAKFRTETKAIYPVYSTDGTALKTAIRSNPGLILIINGEVKDMWHYNDLPAFDDVKKTYFKK